MANDNNSSSTLLSVRLKSETAKKLITIANYEKRSKSYIGSEAIEEYISNYESQIRAIKQGIKSAKEGKLVPNDEVMEWLESIGTKNERINPVATRKKVISK